MERRLDVRRNLDHRQPVLERAVRLDQPELPLARLEHRLAMVHVSEDIEAALHEAKEMLDAAA